MKLPGGWVMIVAIGLILIVVWQWHGEQEARERGVSAPAARTVPTAPSIDRHTVPSDSIALIRAVATRYDVPAGLLYGVWRKESGGLASGWGSGRGWLRAADLSEAGSRCYREYSAERCRRWWDGLNAICSQRRNGAPICDPNEVRTSYAFAMGPMQVLPTVVLDIAPNGTTSWTRYAVDFDGDGVIDPHSLPDAMAIAARHIRTHFDEKRGTMSETDAWIWAANRYYGSQSAGYYEGTEDGRLGIQDHWQRWCELVGTCASRNVLASAR